MSITKETFLNYLNLGISIIPCGKNKRALVKWEEYQKRLPTIEEVDTWFCNFQEISCIAMVTGSISSICIIDIDLPIDIKFLLEPYINNNIYIYNNIIISLREFVDTFDIKLVSKTPRGGVHLWFKTPEKCPENTVNIFPKVDFRGEGGYALIPPSIAWDSDKLKEGKKVDGKYTFHTKMDSLKDTINSLSILPEKFINLLSTSTSKTVHRTSTVSTNVHKHFIDGQRDIDLFKTAMSLADGKCSESLMREAIHRLALSCDFDENEAETKVESAMKRYFKKHFNLAEEVKEFVLSTSGSFLSTDVYNCLYLSTRDEKKNVSEILRRLVIERVIEKDKRQNAKWRKIESEEEVMDLDEPEQPKKDVWLPMDLHNICYLHPKNIMVIAGVSETGKTTWLLNIAKKNCLRDDVYYFSSEMGTTELKHRLKSFDNGIKDFKKVNFINRSSNFEDVIRPDAINIIDFLEIHEEHYRIGVILQRIYEKLTTGIAIIAIQKDAKKEFGVGGNVTQEKARIYVNLDHGAGCSTATIVKGKNWTDERVCPNKRKRDYWVLNGSELKPKGDWYKEGEQDISFKRKDIWDND